MKIETKTKITINLDEKEYVLTRSEAEDLYYKLKNELVFHPTIPQNPLPQNPNLPLHTPTYPSFPPVWCSTP